MTDRFLRDREVTRLTGVSRSKRYTLMAAGEFPKPVSIGGICVAWSEREIAEWQKARIAQRDGKAA
jgi:prophage regulatory protein